MTPDLFVKNLARTAVAETNRAATHATVAGAVTDATIWNQLRLNLGIKAPCVTVKKSQRVKHVDAISMGMTHTLELVRCAAQCTDVAVTAWQS
jgi:hypothetical protein